eukprot:4369679-Lingulodinium_polyedra.AAC.1
MSTSLPSTGCFVSRARPIGQRLTSALHGATDLSNARANSSGSFLSPIRPPALGRMTSSPACVSTDTAASSCLCWKNSRPAT